jgi:hypothetical protein
MPLRGDSIDLTRVHAAPASLHRPRTGPCAHDSGAFTPADTGHILHCIDPSNSPACHRAAPLMLYSARCRATCPCATCPCATCRCATCRWAPSPSPRSPSRVLVSPGSAGTKTSANRESTTVCMRLQSSASRSCLPAPFSGAVPAWTPLAGHPMEMCRPLDLKATLHAAPPTPLPAALDEQVWQQPAGVHLSFAAPTMGHHRHVLRCLLAFALLVAAIHTCDADDYPSAERPSGGTSKPKTVRVEAHGRS